MPCAHRTPQLGCGVGCPSTSTRHRRQPPDGRQLWVVTQAWDVYAVGQSRFEDGCPGRDLHGLAINRECGHRPPVCTVAVYRVLRGNLPSLPDAAARLRPPSMGQTPAGQRWSTIWARYSSLKIAHGGEDRVGRCLPQPTQGAQAHGLAQAQQAVKIGLALPGRG